MFSVWWGKSCVCLCPPQNNNRFCDFASLTLTMGGTFLRSPCCWPSLKRGYFPWWNSFMSFIGDFYSVSFCMHEIKLYADALYKQHDGSHASVCICFMLYTSAYTYSVYVLLREWWWKWICSISGFSLCVSPCGHTHQTRLVLSVLSLSLAFNGDWTLMCLCCC